MKITVILTAVIGCLLFGSEQVMASCTKVGTTWEADPDLASVQSCVGQAAENGTVRVKSGQATWSSPLQLNKGINLIGSGVGVTTITANVPMQDEWTCGYLIKYNPSDYVVDHPVRISSFTFDLNNKSSAIELGPSRKTVPPIFTVQTKARVDNNLFVNQSNDVCHALWFSGPVRGVVDSNVFTNIAYPARADEPQGQPEPPRARERLVVAGLAGLWSQRRFIGPSSLWESRGQPLL